MAVRQALRTPKRRGLRVSAGLVALGLAGQVMPTSAAVFPAEFELSSLQSAAGGDGSQGFVLNGITANDRSGWSVSTAGDVNGDGIDDLIIGAERAGPDGRTYAGQSYVLFGREAMNIFPAEFELSHLLSSNGGDGSEGFVLNGIDENDFSGRSVGMAGDINGDGIDDLIVSGHSADPGGRTNAGESYVVFGREATTGFPAEFELSSLQTANGGDGSDGFVLNGIDGFDRAGVSLGAAGDVNDDGIDDLVVGTFGAAADSRYSAGETYVVFGRDSTSSFPAEFELSNLQAAHGGDGSDGFLLNGVDQYDFSGTSVSAAGDVNGDGIDDLVIGAYQADPGGRSEAGETFIVFGRDSASAFPAEFELSNLQAAHGGDGSEGFVLNGIDEDDWSGRSVSLAGDLNGDGIGDILIGAYYADPGGRDRAGEAYVVFGRHAMSAFSAEIDLSSLLMINGGDGSDGFVLNGINAEDRLSWVSGVGDVNGDNIADLSIGACCADPDGRSYAGQTYVIFGRDATSAFPAEFELSSLQIINGGDGEEGFVLNGIDAYDRSSQAVSAAGDINGDGVGDIVIGARRANPGGRLLAGESYVVFGRKTDSDGDGVPDIDDNCTEEMNPSQCDTNGDGYGNHCDADLDNDGGVTQGDLGIFRSQFGMTSPTVPDLDADLNCDGGVTQTDLGLFRSLFNQPPGPSAFAP